MFGKKYVNMREKIKILKRSNMFTDKISEFERMFELYSMGLYNASEQDYENMITSYGLLNKLDIIAYGFPSYVYNEYKKISIDLSSNTRQYICKNCNTPLYQQSSAYICNDCGYIEKVQQVYYGMSQPKKTYKSKSAINNYCEEWLDYLQGKGIVNLPPEIFRGLLTAGKIMCRGQVSLVSEIKCKDIRRWLSQLKATKYNKYVPSLHRRITRELGNEIIPPQFNEEEKAIIISDWRYLSPVYNVEYNKLKQRGKTKKNNNSYYPVFILLIVQMRFGNTERTRRFEEYIHTQSVDTYKLRLQCWVITCKKLNYTGTGRYGD